MTQVKQDAAYDTFQPNEIAKIISNIALNFLDFQRGECKVGDQFQLVPHLLIPHFNKDTKACDANDTKPKGPLANAINKALDFAKPHD